MKPEQAARLLNAYVDRELDLASSLELEAYLANDPASRAACERLEKLSSAVRADADYYCAPGKLRDRLVASLEPREPRAAAKRALAYWPVAVAFAAGVLFTLAGPLLAPSGEEDRLAQEIVASHVRATLGNRLVDVASSDRHTVKPWLSGRLDFSPPVQDFAANGFELVGGRVDYIGSRAVADLVYRHRQHIVDVFLWPAGADRPVRALAQQGFNVLHFARGGMSYWLVSDVALADLEAFAQSLPRSATQ